MGDAAIVELLCASGANVHAREKAGASPLHLAAQAGHTERISLKHYLSMVSKDEAETFWNIFPEETLKAAA